MPARSVSIHQHRRAFAGEVVVEDGRGFAVGVSDSEVREASDVDDWRFPAPSPLLRDSGSRPGATPLPEVREPRSGALGLAANEGIREDRV